MRYLKMLGLAAIAALALMAVVGAGSASAATVCSLAGTGTSCGGSHGFHYTGTMHAATEAGKPAELQSGFDNVKCDSTVHVVEVTTEGTGFVDDLTFTNCVDSFGHTCTAKSNASTTNKWHAQATTGTAPNGTLTVKNVNGQFTCPNPLKPSEMVTCIYAAESASATVTGGAPAKVTATKVALTKQPGSGASCSSTATWSGAYSVSTPSSLYLT